MVAFTPFQQVFTAVNFIFCIYKYFPYGGLQRDFIHFLDEAVGRGHQVKVYCTTWVGERPSGIEVRLLPSSGFTNHARNAHFYRLFREEIKDEQYDAIVGFNKMPGLDIYFAGDSCYESKARLDRPWPYRLIGRYRHFSRFEKAVFEQSSATHILLISESEKKKFNRFYKTPEQRMHMLPPGISRDRCSPADAAEHRQQVRQRLSLQDDDILLLFIGSAYKTKGLDRVLKGLASLSDEHRAKVTLVVIGQGKLEQYQSLAKKLLVVDRVLFLGGRDDVPEYLLAADLLVHPARQEAAGMVLLEAVVAGLPVLTTDICGYATHINKAGCGEVLESPFSQQALNQSLLSIISSPLMLQEWKAAALDYAASHDLYSMHQTGMDLIEKLTRDRLSLTDK